MTRWKSLATFALATIPGLSSAYAQDKLPRPVLPASPPSLPTPPPPLPTPPINIGTIPGGGVGPVLPVPGTGGKVTITPGVIIDSQLNMRPAIGGGVTIPLGKP